MPSIWINGRFIDAEDASIPLSDAGLLYAAGVFTTMRAFRGRVYRLPEHLSRLRTSCEALFIPLQYKDDDLAVAVDELLDRNALPDARLRLTVTRGTSNQDPIHGQHLQPNVFLTATAVTPYPPEFYQRGITVTVVDDQKLNPYDLQAGHKTVNYFSRLAALRSANKLGAAEALWFNVHNYLQSGSITNVFALKNGQIRTPPTAGELRDKAVADSIPYPKSNVLPGTTRHAVLTLAAQNRIDTRLTALTIDDLLEADELFVTNSNMLVMPVTKVENKAIGNGEPGPLTRQLMALLEADIGSRVG